MSRVVNSTKNLVTGAFGEVLIMVLKFVTRSVFIKTLGEQYLGVSALFTNIISVLSLAELGVGEAIIFNLYKPIAKSDYNKINQIMAVYKTAYRIIGIVITVIGLCLIPFLNVIIKDDISFFNAPLVFVLFLLQSVSTYLFFAYKRTLIIANQMNYKITVLNYFFVIGSNISQIAILYLTRNFELYVAVLIIFNVLQNLAVARMSTKLFPYTKSKPDGKLPKEEIREIFKNCYAIFIYKVNGVVLNATDNIVLSTFIGLEIVGRYSNYLLIYASIKSILILFYNAITASLGNLHASEDVQREQFVFSTVNLITVALFGVASIGMFIVANPFIVAWIGEEYLLPQSFVLLMAVECYMYGFQKVFASFRTAMGLFQQVKYRPVVGIIVNLIVSLICVQYVGIYGVVIGTIVANTTTYMWYDPLVIFKFVFKKSTAPYYLDMLKYTAVIAVCGAVCYFITNLLTLSGWLAVIVYSIICTMVVLGMIFAVYGRSKEAKYLYSILGNYKDKLLKKSKS